jgi:hypothetical protein
LLQTEGEGFVTNGLRHGRGAGVLFAGLGLLVPTLALAQVPGTAQDGSAPPASPAAVPTTITITCSSKPGERQHCTADTSHGVALARSAGQSPCMLGRTWGYDAQGVWVSDGCAGEFVVGRGIQETTEQPQAKEKPPAYIPNMGFLIVEGQKGEMYVRLFSYVRYLNQKGLDSSYTNFFGQTIAVKQREDVQLNKFFLALPGWFLTPKFRYYLYVWSANTSQGDPAQVEGELSTKLKYMAMIGNNLSQLGVSAAQLDNTFNTTSFMLGWLPTTGEFGLYGTFGDYDYHDKVATRLAGHYTHSREDKQTQPGTNSIENSQIRLTDGSILFTQDLFGPGITVEKVDYDMVSVDAGVKKKGFSLEGEYYWRWLSNFEGPNTAGIADINDHGFQLQSSAMLVPKTLQVYLSGSKILGRYGDGSEVRAGFNWYVARERGLRLNAEWIHLNNCPVGYTAVPYPVGGNGSVFHTNFEMNF